MRWIPFITTLAILAQVFLGGAASATETEKPLTISIPPPQARTLKGIVNPPLDNVRFELGDSVRLDRVFDPLGQAAEGCIDKPAVDARFCMDPVSWPAPVMAAIELADENDTIYRGGRAVIRYDENMVSQAHVMFPSSAFIDLIEHLTARYGAPTEQEINVRPVPGDVEVSNTIVRWKSLPTNGNNPMVLEVRAFDDVRHVTPDRQHGFVWLHREGATPVFRHFTTIDLMVLRQRRLGLWPADEDAGD